MEVMYLVTTVHRDNGTFTKGVQVKPTRDEAQQAFHNEFTAWAYGKVATCDYVCAYINDTNGAVVRAPEVWFKEETEPEVTGE